MAKAGRSLRGCLCGAQCPRSCSDLIRCHTLRCAAAPGQPGRQRPKRMPESARPSSLASWRCAARDRRSAFRSAASWAYGTGVVARHSRHCFSSCARRCNIPLSGGQPMCCAILAKGTVGFLVALVTEARLVCAQCVAHVARCVLHTRRLHALYDWSIEVAWQPGVWQPTLHLGALLSAGALSMLLGTIVSVAWPSFRSPNPCIVTLVARALVRFARQFR